MFVVAMASPASAAQSPVEPAGDQVAATRLVSKTSDGIIGNSFSRFPATSDSGRFVAYESYATNLVTGDTNQSDDVFIWDRTAKTTTMVSVPIGDAEMYKGSYGASISGNGRYIAFWSEASNLVPGDTNGKPDVFVRDRVSGTTTLVSRDASGSPGNKPSVDPAISSDGRFIAYSSEASNLDPRSGLKVDIFVYDQTTGTNEAVSMGSSGEGANGDSTTPSISIDGRYVAFASEARNLVGGDRNGVSDVFVVDRSDGSTVLVSTALGGGSGAGASRAPSISAAGQHVAFSSLATDLVASDPNAVSDVFVRDLAAASTELISKTASSPANAKSDDPTISGNGRVVTFWTSASNLVEGDENGFDDVMSYDRKKAKTTLISARLDGDSATGASYTPAVTRDGKSIAFFSWADDIVAGDTNQYADVMIRRLK